MIGIVGGVGPYAGLDLAKNIFDNTIAESDQDHLPLVMLSMSETILDRTEYLLGEVVDNPGLAIADVLLRMEKTGATVAGIPCNTAHAEKIFSLTKQVLNEHDSQLKLLNMVEETINTIKVEYPNIKKVGVISTTGSCLFEIYSKPLQLAGFEAIIPPEQVQEEIVHPAIYDKAYGIKANTNPVTERAKEDLLDTIGLLQQCGAELIIKGCTEIALAIPDQIVNGVPTIDPSIVLARKLIEHENPSKLKPTIQ
ncbi:MAG: aspartate racemase [Bacteroidetes bacterium]|nr:MAG: aspartate racemase [Bacteroidota bacterium]